MKYILASGFYTKALGQLARGDIAEFADPEEKDSKLPKAPSSAVPLDSEEGQKLAAKFGVTDKTEEYIPEDEPEMDLNVDAKNPKAVSELAKKKGK